MVISFDILCARGGTPYHLINKFILYLHIVEPLSQMDDADRRTAKYYELKARYEVIMGKKRAKLHNFTHYSNLLTMELT